MNSSAGIFWCIFAIVVTNSTTHFAVGQYEPLFTSITKPAFEIEYDLIYDVKYDVADKQLVVMQQDRDISLACPRANDSNAVEIQGNVSKRALITLSCDTPVKSHIFVTEPLFNFLPNTHTIGFLLFTPNERLDQVYVDVFENYAVLELILFKYKETLGRVENVSYRLGAGKFLKPEISTENRNEEYEKDEDIFKYDLDQLYHLTEFSVVKVSLAPEEDFFFANWKSASRHDILTAPMWQELLPQWQALEIFIRKVAQIIDSVKVKTGVYDGTDVSEKIYLHDGKHPIPKYFWKAIYIEAFDEHLHDYNHGILFVMHNVDPNAESNEQKICPDDDVSETGWQFLPDTEMKSLMYGCFFTTANMKFFQEKTPSERNYNPFDLHAVPVELRINVLDEMEKLEKAKNQKQKISSYPDTFIEEKSS